ncbi:MAG: SBBP repeat-containing protein [Dehalococcoidales bacterium]|nr:SBBP repeat-containing protein [Dehalococcoidales bacterium]
MKLKALFTVIIISGLIISAGCQPSVSLVPTPAFTYAEWNLDYLAIKYDGAGNQLWVARYNGPGNNADSADALALDDDGNVYVTGASHGSRDSGIRTDYATIKYDSNGNELWVARYEGPTGSDVSARALAVDGDGNVYVTGNYATIKYDNGGNELWVARHDETGASISEIKTLALDSDGNVYITGTSRGDSGHDDYVTIKYDSNGSQLWLARYDDGSPTALAVDTAGNVYVTGFSRANNDINGYLTIKYDNAGNQLWTAAYNFPGYGGHIAYALAVDDTGNVCVTGRSYSAHVSDYATVKYDSQGNELWVARYNGPGDSSDQANSLTVDADGNVYVTGKSNDKNRDFDYATLKYSSDGKILWEARYEGPGNDNDMATALEVDDFGNVYVTGRSHGNNSGWDSATVKYNGKGKQLWAARYNGPGNSTDEATAIAVDAEDNVYITGRSVGTAGVLITNQSPWPDVPVYTDPGKVVETRVGLEFAFGFETVTRLPGGWEESHDENIVSLVGNELVMNQTSGTVSGTTWYSFKALKLGETRITFKLGERETKEFRIKIE